MCVVVDVFTTTIVYSVRGVLNAQLMVHILYVSEECYFANIYKNGKLFIIFGLTTL
jgi:hypothetical protein